MELWIRSQDKTLLRKPEQLGAVNGDEYWHISENLLIDYGCYATKERALEVLDEIQITIAKNQSLISLMQNFTDLKDHEEDISRLFKDMIYEMPEK